jgi:hypothetical protein
MMFGGYAGSVARSFRYMLLLHRLPRFLVLAAQSSNILQVVYAMFSIDGFYPFNAVGTCKPTSENYAQNESLNCIYYIPNYCHCIFTRLTIGYVMKHLKEYKRQRRF